MPSSTERQRRFMGAELARARAGKRTRTGMMPRQLEEFAGSVAAKRVGPSKKKVAKNSPKRSSRRARRAR